MHSVIVMAEKKDLITKDMTIAEIISKHPEVAHIMLEGGMHCIGCAVAASESFEDGAIAHGLTEAQVDKMIKQMNDAAKKSTGGKIHGKGNR